MTPEKIAVSLGGSSRKANGGYMARCPIHDDSTSSLSIDEKDGRLLVKCMANCSQADVVGELKRRGLWPDSGDHPAQSNTQSLKRKLVATYDYLDESGSLLFQAVRYEPKDFRQRRPDGKGGWIYNLEGVTTCLYNLSGFINSNWVVIVEGEKDVDNLKALGIPATCSPMGAGKWRDHYNKYFAGKAVAIISDNDKAGIDHAVAVAEQLKPVARIVKLITLEGLPPKGDISDWLLIERNSKEALIGIIKASPEWVEITAPDEVSDLHGDSENLDSNVLATDNGETFSLISGRALRAMNIKIEWLIDGLIPRNAVILLYGRGGIGKTTLMMMLANALDRGESVFGMATTKTQVIIVDYENSRAVLSERAKRTAVDGVLFMDSSQNPPPLDKDEWEQYLFMLEQHSNAVFVFDTLRSSHSGDENDSKVMTLIMRRMRQLRDAGATVVLLHHTPKSNDRQFKGSGAIFDLCDQTLALYQTKQVGSEQEAADDDDDPSKVYRFGTGRKTRYRPHRVYLSFDVDQEVFIMAKNPEEEALEYLHSIISQIDATTSAKQKTITDKVAEDGGCDLGGDKKIIELLKKGVGRFWTTTKGMHNAIIYHPIQFGSLATPIGGEKLPNRNHTADQCGNTVEKQLEDTAVEMSMVTGFGSLAEGIYQTEKLGVELSTPDFNF